MCEREWRGRRCEGRGARSLGARYAVLVADHFSGFLLWPGGGGSGAPTLADTASPAPPDLVSAFAAAAARHPL